MKAEAELINISRAKIGLMRNLKQSTCTARAMKTRCYFEKGNDELE